eukprot:gene57640-biopygen89335
MPRTLLCPEGGGGAALTRDHRASDAAEAARVRACGGHVCDLGRPRVAYRLLVTRAIGDYAEGGIVVCTSPGPRALGSALAADGWRVVRLVRAAPPAARLANI